MNQSSHTGASPLNRTARRREQTQRDLLGAAKRVFASKGYFQTKVSDIAADADVGVGTFYLHYDGKEALFAKLVDQTARQLKARIDTAKARVTNPAEQARVSCEEFFRFARDNRETFRILFGQDTFNQTIRNAQDIFIADIAESITAGIRQGVFAAYPPAVIAQAVIGVLTQVVSWWITNEEVRLEEVVEATNRFIASGLVAHASTEIGRS